MTDGEKKLTSEVSAAVRPVAMEDKPAECDVTDRVCPCCYAVDWFQCHCDEDCEVGRQRIAEGRDSTDVEGDPYSRGGGR